MITRRLLQKLSRVTSSGRYIAEIDGLRFLAIVPVVLVHVRNFLLVKTGDSYALAPQDDWLAHLTAHGHYGVQLFFVISGFVLALPFAAHYLQGSAPVKLRGYYLRRLTRLEPPYILCLLLCFCLFLLLGKDSFGNLLPPLIAGIFYSHGLVYGQHNVLNLITWSLEVEIQFYLLMPLLAKLFTIKGKFGRRALILLASLVLVACQSLFLQTEGRLSLSILNFLQYFLMGFLLADVYLCDWHETPAHHIAWDFLSLAGWPLMLLLFEWPKLTALLLPFCLFWLFYAAFRGVYVRRALTQPLITVLGGMCYTIYLVHFQLISLVGRLFPPLKISERFFINYLLALPVFIFVITAASLLFFYFVEKPCMRRDWPQRLLSKIRELAQTENKLEKSVLPSTE